MPPLLLRLSLLAPLPLVSVSCVSMSHQTPVAQCEGPQQMAAEGVPAHFICWNVQKAGRKDFAEDVRTLLDAIPEDEPVTLCLQEARCSTFEMIRGLHREEVSGHYAPSWKLAFSNQSTGVLTMADQPLSASGVRSIRSPRREMYVATPKVSLRSEIPLADGRMLQIINCHGLNFVPLTVLPMQLERVFGALRCSTSPAIVCGDFNVWSERRLALLNAHAARAGLVEAHPRGETHSPAPKWLAWLNPVIGFDPDIRLDRIYTRGIEVIDCHSCTRSRSSDHQPLVLSYRVLPES